MSDIYFIKISEIPVISSRTQKEFDNLLLKYIEKFKVITKNTDTIAHLIATSIDYPVNYVRELINTYIRSGLLNYNLDRRYNDDLFVREKTYIKGYKTLYFVYDRKDNQLNELEQTQIKEYDDKKGKITELDNNDYLNVFLQLFDNDNFFNRNTKEKDKYLMSLTIRKLKENEYKDFFKDKIEFYLLDMLSEKQIDKIKKSSLNDYRNKLRFYNKNYKFLNEIKTGKGYYEYNLALNNRKDSIICDKSVSELLDIAKESIFIITTQIGTKSKSKTFSFEKIDELKSDKKIYIRTIEGFKNQNELLINVEQDKNNYSQIFGDMIHSKIIVVDNFFVALGSGNWFSSQRQNFEDSLVIFPCFDAVSKYCPIYYPTADYYKIFEQKINEVNDLSKLFDLYLIMQKDLLYDVSNTKNVYDELLIRKIEKSMESNIDKSFESIVKFLDKENYNSGEFFDYLLLSDKVDDKYKDELRNIYIDRGEN